MRSVHDNELVNQIRMIRNNTPVRKRKTTEKEKRKTEIRRRKKKVKFNLTNALAP